MRLFLFFFSFFLFPLFILVEGYCGFPFISATTMTVISTLILCLELKEVIDLWNSKEAFLDIRLSLSDL